MRKNICKKKDCFLAKTISQLHNSYMNISTKLTNFNWFIFI